MRVVLLALALMLPLLAPASAVEAPIESPVHRFVEDWEDGDTAGWYTFGQEGRLLCTSTPHGCIYGLASHLATRTEAQSLPPYVAGVYQAEASFIPPLGATSTIGIALSSNAHEHLELIVRPTGMWEFKLSWGTTSLLIGEGSTRVYLPPEDGWITLRIDSNTLTGELSGSLIDDQGKVVKTLTLTGMKPSGAVNGIVILGSPSSTGTTTFVDDIHLDLVA